jgi:uncharacterized membrane protein YphA (DoxX/SURF4 family)
MSYTQNFAGLLFLFSGWVKAVDPLGTAFKMEDYFAEFFVTFSGTSMSFLAPLFPFLSGYSTIFAIFMIVFEIVLGLMLILGDRPKLTAWLFFLLVLFFTALTGFTFLTGFVPGDQNFFSFSEWTAYDAKNMRVTDCGCFGDFIKLEPRISFYKDVLLLIPAFFFIWKYRDMHQWFDSSARNTINTGLTALLLVYCVYNFHWNEPHVDFRPFKNGAPVFEIQQNERKAASAVQVVAMKMKNKTTGEIKEIPYNEYLKNLASLTEEFETIEQIKTEPSIPATKISDFSITTFSGEEMGDIYLQNPEPHIMIPIYKAKYTMNPVVKTVTDTLYNIDTMAVDGYKDSLSIVKSVREILTKEVPSYDLVWDEDFILTLKSVILPLQKAASGDNVEVSVVVSGIDEEKAASLAEASGINVPYYTADEKLIKTIMRSNPGIILWKDGVLIQKWHYKKLPEWSEIKTSFLK